MRRCVSIGACAGNCDPSFVYVSRRLINDVVFNAGVTSFAVRAFVFLPRSQFVAGMITLRRVACELPLGLLVSETGSSMFRKLGFLWIVPSLAYSGIYFL